MYHYQEDLYYEVWQKYDSVCFATFRFKQAALDYASTLRSHGIESFVYEVNRDIIKE